MVLVLSGNHVLLFSCFARQLGNCWSYVTHSLSFSCVCAALFGDYCLHYVSAYVFCPCKHACRFAIDCKSGSSDCNWRFCWSKIRFLMVHLHWSKIFLWYQWYVYIFKENQRGVVQVIKFCEFMSLSIEWNLDMKQMIGILRRQRIEKYLYHFGLDSP